MPVYSVVVSTLPDSQTWLQPCLTSLLEKTEGSFEIVLVAHEGDQSALSVSSLDERIKLIPLDPDKEPTHFSYCYNKGLAQATGDYLIVLNDDTVVSQGWNTSIMKAQNHAEAERDRRVGILGPLSNNVAGMQKVELEQRVRAEDTETVATMLKDVNGEEYLTTQFISGFCQFFRRSFYDEMREDTSTFFNEELENGAEDNLICLRAILKGYLNIVVGGSYVFHHGSKTMDNVAADNGRGCAQLFNYYKLAQEYLPDTEKVASACRVRLLHEDHRAVFLKALEQHLQLSDVVVLVNDRSKDWPDEEIQALSDKYGTPVNIFEYRRGHDETRDRQKLLDMAREAEATWYLSFDADEIFEDKFDKAYLQKLIHPPRPDILSYAFHWYTFWDEACTMWRVDSTFGNMHGARLARILPEYEMKQTESGLHMGNIPGQELPDSSRVTSVRIKHYGYHTEEERARKYEFYEAIDKVKNIKEVGQEGYSHLIPNVYQLVRFDEDNGVSLGTIVRNEEINLHNWLSENWSFADELVFCDTGSTDSTVELLKYWGATVYDYNEETGEEWDPERVDLGRARNIVLNNIKTKWYWHQDIDENMIRDRAQSHPLAMIRRMIEKPTVDGFQFMFRNFSPQGVWVHSQCTRLMKNPERFQYSGYVHETIDKTTDGTSIELAPIEIAHAGWLVPDKRAKEKLKIYLRGNLRMCEDYPNDPRGWFNAGLHLFDIGYTAAGMHFLQKAITIKRDFPAAVKELVAQGAKALRQQSMALNSICPPGHPFQIYAQELSDNLENYAADNEQLVRCPEHVEEVLAEVEFRKLTEYIMEFEVQSLDG